MQPPLLNRPGMGAKLVTYYRKQKADDVGHQKLKQGGLGCACPCGYFLLAGKWTCR